MKKYLELALTKYVLLGLTALLFSCEKEVNNQGNGTNGGTECTSECGIITAFLGGEIKGGSTYYVNFTAQNECSGKIQKFSKSGLFMNENSVGETICVGETW